jgi:hypothetical protein
MADEKKQEVSHVSICCVENGYKIECCYEAAEKSLGARAGWYPAPPGESKSYVEKTKDAVLKRLKEIL